MKQIVTTVCAMLLLGGVAMAQNVTVSSAKGEMPGTFVQDNLAGGGVYIFNAKFNNSSGAIATPNIGTFQSNGYEGLSMEKGIVLTTGDVSIAAGPNDNSGASSQVSPAYIDPIINEYVPQGATECAVLEFDFVCMSNYISFNYCFGSEEYQNFTCTSFNDMFAFFLTGPDPETGEELMRNIAIIPGTATDLNPDGIPVAVNSVNEGKPTGSGVADNCISLDYSDYFVKNYYNYSTGPIEGVQYEGYTNKLIAEASIVPCAVYHIYITICNVSDKAYDSGVFIEGNSFEAPTAAIGLSRPDVGQVLGSCPFAIPLTLANTGFEHGTINITTDGTAKMGVDYDLIDDEGNIVVNQFDIDESVRKLYIRGRQDADLSSNKTIELNFATSLCAQFPQMVVYDTQHFNLTKGTDVKLGDTTIAATQACFRVSAPLVYGNPTSYRWEPTTGIDNPYARESSANITESRDYKLYATGGTGCNTSVANVSVKVSGSGPTDYVGIDEAGTPIATVRVAEGKIVVEAEGLQRVELYDVEGRQLVDQATSQISTANLAQGIYTVRVSTDKGVSTTKISLTK